MGSVRCYAVPGKLKNSSRVYTILLTICSTRLSGGGGRVGLGGRFSLRHGLAAWCITSSLAVLMLIGGILAGCLSEIGVPGTEYTFLLSTVPPLLASPLCQEDGAGDRDSGDSEPGSGI